MKLTAAAEIPFDKSDDPRKAVQSRRNALAALGRALRDMSDQIANRGNSSGEIDHEGVKGTFKVED